MLKKGLSENFSVKNTTKGRLPSLPFHQIKENILGKKYELSLVFIGEKKSKELNKKWRDKNKPANVLSFSLSSNTGEIFISPQKAKKEFEKFDMNFKNFLLYLFIHGLLHLKGMEHGSKMDRAEQKFFQKWKTLP